MFSISNRCSSSPGVLPIIYNYMYSVYKIGGTYPIYRFHSNPFESTRQCIFSITIRINNIKRTIGGNVVANTKGSDITFN